MKLRVFNILKKTKVEGPQTRYCIWVQGCSRHCKGCQAVHTWSHSGGMLIDVGDIIADIKAQSGIEGVTFLGGEPFEQAETLGIIAKEIKAAGLGVLCFTGDLIENLKVKYIPVPTNKINKGGPHTIPSIFFNTSSKLIKKLIKKSSLKIKIYRRRLEIVCSL